MTNPDVLVRRIERARERADRKRAEATEAQAKYVQAVAEANAELGATELARRLGVHRQRIYQLLGKVG